MTLGVLATVMVCLIVTIKSVVRNQYILVPLIMMLFQGIGTVALLSSEGEEDPSAAPNGYQAARVTPSATEQKLPESTSTRPVTPHGLEASIEMSSHSPLSVSRPVALAPSNYSSSKGQSTDITGTITATTASSSTDNTISFTNTTFERGSTSSLKGISRLNGERDRSSEENLVHLPISSSVSERPSASISMPTPARDRALKNSISGPSIVQPSGL